MKDNARAELEAILDMAMEWGKDNGKDYLNISVVNGNGYTTLSTDDADFEETSIYKQGGQQ